MGIESKHTNDSPAVFIDMSSLNERLRPYFYDLTDPTLQKGKEIFLENVPKSKELQALITEFPDSFDLIFYLTSTRVYTSEELASITRNIRTRQEEIVSNEKEVKERVRSNPHATSEEYILGTFREALETQVREAVFALLKKGYRPVGSGFYDLVKGTQAIFLDARDVNVDAVRRDLPQDVIVTKVHGRVIINFKPQSETTVKDIKQRWDEIVELIPFNNSSEKSVSDNGEQGSEFRKIQDDIKRGKDTWLGRGLAFIGGAVVEISHDDFIKNYQGR